jgi:MFS transporter, Spinster family, sphingosine-1-phosphate transporter
MTAMAFHPNAAPDTLPGYHPVPRRYGWTVFAVLVALMVVDYIDRQVVVSMFSHLKYEWNLSDSRLGALVSVVSVTVALGAVPLSLLADRWSRVKSIFLMALIWSLATIACAFAESYWHLLAARSMVGLGEAAYGTVGAALLATLFPRRMRSTVLGAFLAAGMLGSVLGVILGGVIAEHWGWQAGFGAVGVPGLLLALLFLVTARDYKTVALPPAAMSKGGARTGMGAVASELLRPRSAPITCVGAGLQLLAVSTIYAWLPSYLTRSYGLAPDQAGLRAGVVVLAAGIGAVIWSTVADRLSVRIPRARLYVPAAVAVLTTSLLCPALAFLPPGPGQYAMLVAGGFVMAGSIGPVAAVVVDVTHPGLRATASAVLALTQNLIGLAGGPLLTGLLSDRYGLQSAMAAAPMFCLLAAAMFLLAARTYEADLRHATAAAPVIDLSPGLQNE